MIKAKLKKHIGYYIAFTLVQTLGLIVVLLASGNRSTQMLAILGTSIFYFVFAIVHHVLDHDLTSKIVIEYALVGALGLSVSLFTFSNI